MSRRAEPLVLAEPWLGLIGSHPDDARDFIAAVGAPYPAQMGEALVLTGRRSGVSIEVVRSRSGGHYIDRITADLKIHSKSKMAMTMPFNLVAGEARVAVHARLGAPRYTERGDERWSVDGGSYLAVSYEDDNVVGMSLGFVD